MKLWSEKRYNKTGAIPWSLLTQNRFLVQAADIPDQWCAEYCAVLQKPKTFQEYAS